jgi:prepilin-type processing-associated H-X9-DG protein
MTGQLNSVAGINSGLRLSGDTHWWSFHDGGALFLFADGHTQLLPYTIEHNTLIALSTRAGGEVVELP